MDSNDYKIYKIKRKYLKKNLYDDLKLYKKLSKYLNKTKKDSIFIRKIKKLNLTFNNEFIFLNNIIFITSNTTKDLISSLSRMQVLKILDRKDNNYIILFKETIFALEVEKKYLSSNKIIEILIISKCICLNIYGFFYSRIVKLVSLKFLKLKLKRTLFYIIWLCLEALNFKYYSFRFRYKKLSYKEFLELKIIDDNILNSLLRDEHFNIITQNKTILKIKEIINFFSKKENLFKKLNVSKQPKNIKMSSLPRHLDREFWDNGNSYFLNCIVAGFRENINNYENMQFMLDKNNHVNFSIDYYESQKKMDQKDIQRLLKENPIHISKGCISSGRHRVSAMIGRLISGEDYIPFFQDKFHN